MNEMFYRQSALDCIANGLLKNYRNGMYMYAKIKLSQSGQK